MPSTIGVKGFWYSIGELRILAYGKSAVLREPSAARLDPSLQNGPPDRSASRSGPFGFEPLLHLTVYQMKTDRLAYPFHLVHHQGFTRMLRIRRPARGSAVLGPERSTGPFCPFGFSPLLASQNKTDACASALFWYTIRGSNPGHPD